jgi:tRNA(fMet)-specific endonuclease VapC
VSLRYLLDTNVISEPLRPTPNVGVLSRLHVHQAELAIPALVWHELRFGCERLPQSAKRTAIEADLDQVIATSVPILPYDDRAAAWHAVERARLVVAGQTPPFVDGQIAAIAQTNDLVLVTRNVQDFAGFDGLQMEDWFQ